MDRFITLEEHKKRLVVGLLCADDLDDAHNQLIDVDKVIVVPESQVNQLIVDINKMARRKL